MQKMEAVGKWDVYEVVLDGPQNGNPFTDVDLSAVFTCGTKRVTVTGFYNGNGNYVVRFMPDTTGVWRFRTRSNRRQLSGHTGSLRCISPARGNHGPVRVAQQYHFAYADGTPFIPVGTTAYAWIHQSKALIETTFKTLAKSPFNKIRMCTFPKDYDFNKNEPWEFPYDKKADGTFDFTRFNPVFFNRLESYIRRLGVMGIQADMILLHPYDRWGFSNMGKDADDRYLAYITARLAAFHNVWWSMANEFDFMRAKKREEWDRFCSVVRKNDPYRHLLSIHNGMPQDMYEHDKPWISHVSLQWQEEDPGFVRTLRDKYGKPVVVDECGYEGPINHGWGNLTPQELNHKCWSFVIQGGHAACHGETYYRNDEILWWAKGGPLHGKSPARMAFMRKTLERCAWPMEPSPVVGSWDFKAVGSDRAGDYLLYFGRKQPAFRDVNLPKGKRFRAEVIDTWNMTVTKLPGRYRGWCRILLPARPWIVLRLKTV